jgi:hypothetical protein
MPNSIEILKEAIFHLKRNPIVIINTYGVSYGPPPWVRLYRNLFSVHTRLGRLSAFLPSGNAFEIRSQESLRVRVVFLQFTVMV